MEIPVTNIQEQHQLIKDYVLEIFTPIAKEYSLSVVDNNPLECNISLVNKAKTFSIDFYFSFLKQYVDIRYTDLESPERINHKRLDLYLTELRKADTSENKCMHIDYFPVASLPRYMVKNLLMRNRDLLLHYGKHILAGDKTFITDMVIKNEAALAELRKF